MGGNCMQFRTAFYLASLFLVCFTFAAWSAPTPGRLAPANLQPAVENQSLSGSISSVGAAEFSNSSAAAGTQPVAADFHIDQPESLDARDSENRPAPDCQRRSGIPAF